jgi:hypothetical protein
MTALIIAITPIVINIATTFFKWLSNVKDTAGKRILFGLLSLLGVLAASALTALQST